MSARLTWIRSPRFLLAVAALVVLAAVGYPCGPITRCRDLQRAEAALDERLYHKAGDLFAEYLARHPGDARARLLAAKAARRLRDWSKAARASGALPASWAAPRPRRLSTSSAT